jgi:hypothetical protein
MLADIAAHDDLMSRTLVEGIWVDLCDFLAGCAGGFFGVGVNQDKHLVALVARALAVGFEALTAAGSFLSALILSIFRDSYRMDFGLPRFYVLDRFRNLGTFLAHRPLWNHLR